MWDFYLAFLPSSYLSHSVITTIWIGIWVVAFFNLRYGWVFTGLIVPGYLTPLLLIKPLSVGVIIFESIVTYLLVYMLSELAAKRGLWTNFFGRDRFFMILLMSVAVRVFFDAWILPEFVLHLESSYGILIDYNDGFHSFGLIIVALIANQLWKPGLLHGSFQLLTTLAITFLITRYFFVEYTNFSLSNINYMYEDVAASILASPKSYIILIITALIASRMNLFYGWEFNGILVPSLLALQWYEPTKILSSFLEAYIILVLAMALLKLPFFQHKSIEGARKVLLFFNVGFLYKIALSFVLLYFFPEYKVSDFFAFGYLLSTLIAIKIYDKVNMALFTRVTLQTSLVSIVIATLIGYMFTVLPDASYTYKDEFTKSQELDEIKSDENLIKYIVEKKINLYKKDAKSTFQTPEPLELEIFKEVLELSDDFYKNKERIYQLLDILHYEMKLIQERYLVLNQKKEFSGWGMYIIDIKEKGSHLVELPYPLETWDIVESAIVLMKMSKAKALSMSGAPLDAHQKLGSSAYIGYYSLYNVFHKYFSQNSVLQVRSLNPQLQTRLGSIVEAKEESSILFVKGFLPKQLKLSRLKEQVPSLEVSLEDSKEFSIQKESMHNGFSELFLSSSDSLKLVSSQLLYEGDKIAHEVSVNSIEGLLQSWLLDKKLEISEKGSESYIKASVQELLFFDNVVLKPLLHIVDKYQNSSIDSDELNNELSSLLLSTNALGYELTRYTDKSDQKDYLILHEQSQKDKHFWGTYVFALGDSKNIMIQTPRPFYEAQTFEYSLQLYKNLNAKVLLLNGAHPLSNKDRSSDIMLFENQQNIFNLVSQVVYRHSAQTSMNALQVRGMQEDSVSNKKAAVLAFSSAKTRLNEEQKYIFENLQKYMPIIQNEGDAYSAGYDAITLQSLYLDQSIADTFNVLWLPYNVRSQYRQLQENDRVKLQFKSLNIRLKENEFMQELNRPGSASPKSKCHKSLLKHSMHYLNTKDITELESLNQYKNTSLTLLVDTNTKQPYLVFEDSKTGQVVLVLKLNAQPPFKIDTLTEGQSMQEVLHDFHLNTSAVLAMEESCVK